MLRSPEARLAGRLFDADKIVRPLLEANAERFYMGKVLLKSLDSPPQRDEKTKIFEEAFTVLNNAIQMEADNSRVTVHPFSSLLTGTAKYLEQGGALSLSQHDTISRHVVEARYRFQGDAGTAAAIARLDSVM